MDMESQSEGEGLPTIFGFYEAGRKSPFCSGIPPRDVRLVTDVARYPEFLPWCSRVEVLDQEPQAMTAKLHLAYRGVKQAFTTHQHP